MSRGGKGKRGQPFRSWNASALGLKHESEEEPESPNAYQNEPWQKLRRDSWTPTQSYDNKPIARRRNTMPSTLDDNQEYYRSNCNKNDCYNVNRRDEVPIYEESSRDDFFDETDRKQNYSWSSSNCDELPSWNTTSVNYDTSTQKTQYSFSPTNYFQSADTFDDDEVSSYSTVVNAENPKMMQTKSFESTVAESTGDSDEPDTPQTPDHEPTITSNKEIPFLINLDDEQPVSTQQNQPKISQDILALDWGKYQQSLVEEELRSNQQRHQQIQPIRHKLPESLLDFDCL